MKTAQLQEQVDVVVRLRELCARAEQARLSLEASLNLAGRPERPRLTLIEGGKERAGD